jgi:hypothetical protein
LWTGLLRLGLPLADGMPGLVEWHGAPMISAFLGTLISLERAVAIGRWAYAGPCASAIGALALLIGAPWGAALAFLSAALALLGVSVSVAVRHMALFTLVPVIGAACWGTGTLAWMLSYSMRDVAGWWLAFLVLTIAAERLELSRLLAPPRINRLAFALTVALILVGAGRNEFAAGQAVSPVSGS